MFLCGVMYDKESAMHIERDEWMRKSKETTTPNVVFSFVWITQHLLLLVLYVVNRFYY